VSLLQMMKLDHRSLPIQQNLFSIYLFPACRLERSVDAMRKLITVPKKEALISKPAK
jgi:hypothetical protein